MKRQKYIDQAKGLGILCITFLHYENGVLPMAVNTFIGSFMITIFYIVTGWCMAMRDQNISTKELLRRRLRTLGLPYIYWTGIILAFDCILWAFGYYDTYFIARETYKSLVLRGIGTLWFLPALFFGEIGWNWLRDKNKIWWIIALALMIVYGYYYNLIFSHATDSKMKIIQAPFYTISNASHALFYVAMGFLVYRVYSRYCISVVNDAIIGGLLCIAAYFSASYLHLIAGAAAGFLWMFFAPILGPIGFILLFKSFQTSKLLNVLDYWGRNSLSLMVTHYSIVQVLMTICVVNLLHMPFTGWITIIAFVVSMPIQWMITRLIEARAPYLLHAQKI